MPKNTFQVITLIALLLTIVVVTLGAYVRLSDAGLGCPDWPGCYGKMVGVPKGDEVHHANKAFPERPVEAHKAWKEMIHRYFAGTLGILVVVLAVMAWIKRKENPRPLKVNLLLVPLIVLQAALGMWTVTEKLDPFFVTAHLLMGILTLALIGLNYFRETLDLSESKSNNGLAIFGMITAVLLFGQIFLGGWTSTNYAAVVCHDFPTCYDGKWMPKQDFKEAFVIWRGGGINYEGGVLKQDARISVHMTHRLGAVIASVAVILLALLIFIKANVKPIKIIGGVMLALLAAQIALGISVVLMSRPLNLAVAHNGVAAVLFMLSLVAIALLRRND